MSASCRPLLFTYLAAFDGLQLRALAADLPDTGFLMPLCWTCVIYHIVHVPWAFDFRHVNPYLLIVLSALLSVCSLSSLAGHYLLYHLCLTCDVFNCRACRYCSSYSAPLRVLHFTPFMFTISGVQH
jgi:hypothetical protein